MPQLPIYESPMADRGIQPSDLGVRGAEELAHVYKSVGNELGGIAEQTYGAFQQANQLEDSVDFTNKSTDFNIKADQDWKKAQSEGVSAEDFLTKNYEPGQQGLLDGLRTDKGRAAAQMALAEQRRQFANKIFGEEASAAADNAKISLNNSGTTYGTQAFDDPASVAAYYNAWTHSAAFMAGATKMSAADVAEITQKGGEYMYSQAAAGLLHQYEANPHPTDAQRDAIEQILGGADYRKFLGDKYGEYIDKLDRASKTNQDVQGEIAAQALPDLLKQIEQTGDQTRVVQAQGLIDGDKHGSEAEAAVRAADRTRQLESAVAIGTASKAIVNVPDAAVLNNLPALRAKIDAANPDEVGPLQRQYDSILTAIKRRDDGIKTSGAQYFLDNPELYSTVAARYQKFLQTKDPNDFAAYATTVATMERTIDPKNPVRILPRELYDDVAGKIANATQDADGAALVGTTLANLRTLTGPYWNGVAHELQANGVLKSSQFAAAQLIGDPRSAPLAQEIIRSSIIPNDSLTTTSGKPRGAADQLAARSLKDLSATFAETTNGQQLMDSYITAISDVMRARGTVDQATANNLAQAMILDRFNIRSNLRIPKQFDDKDVADGAENIMAHIDTHALVPPQSLSGLGGKAQALAYSQDVRDYGHWITNERGDGAVLRDQFGSPVYEKNAKGQVVQVEVPFADLEKVGKGIRGPLNVMGRFLTNPSSLEGTPGGRTLEQILP